MEVVGPRVAMEILHESQGFHTFIAPNPGVCERKAILADLKRDPVEPSKKGTGRSRFPIVLLVVLLVAALAIGSLGLGSASAKSVYGCMTFKQQGNDVDVVTTGIIHVSGGQYYITCAEGDTYPTTPTTVSCLTVNPRTVDSPYPDGGAAVWYFLSATGHTITAPPISANSTEVLQTPAGTTVTVSC